MDQKFGGLLPFREVDEAVAREPEAPRPATVSFPEIFQNNARFLWRTLMNLGVPSHEAQDLCQEVMLIAHRRLPEFDCRSLRGWLYGICVRVASDYRRSARVRREVPYEVLPDAGRDADQAERLERGRSVDRALHALNQLTDDQRDAFVLYEVEELTLAEISEALGTPLQTVYSRITAARRALRAYVEGGAHPKGVAREAV
jgi:RNA polymerase sigma-70 factor, ECF subfamily